jgi:PITH domain
VNNHLTTQLTFVEMEGMFPSGGGGGGVEAPDTSSDYNGQLMDLISKIDKSDCYARNEAAGFPMTNLFIGDTRLGCKSDADEQLIIHVSFQEFVKVSRLHIFQEWDGKRPLRRATNFDS